MCEYAADCKLKCVRGWMRINKNNKSLYIQEQKHTPDLLEEDESRLAEGIMPSVYVWLCDCCRIFIMCTYTREERNTIVNSSEYEHNNKNKRKNLKDYTNLYYILLKFNYI